MRRAEAKRISTLALVTAALCLVIAVALLLPPVASYFAVGGAPAKVSAATQTTNMESSIGQLDRPASIDRGEAINSLVRLGPPPRPRAAPIPTIAPITPAITQENTGQTDEETALEAGWTYIGQIRARRSYAVLAYEGRQVLVRQGDRLPEPPPSAATPAPSTSPGRPGAPPTQPPVTRPTSQQLRGTLLEVHDTHVILEVAGARRRLDLADMQVAFGQVAPPANPTRTARTPVNDPALMTARGTSDRNAQQNPLANRTMSGGINPIDRDRLLRGLQDGSIRPEDRPDMIQDPSIAEYLREKDPDTYRYLFDKTQDAKSTGGSADPKQGDRRDPVNRIRADELKKQS